MKAMVIEHFGGVEEFKLKEVPTPEPEDHEVLIEIAYTAVNPMDWKIREGYLKDRIPHKFPIVLGWDAAGIIKKIGKQVTSFREEDPVFAYCRKPEVQWGTYGEYVTVDQNAVAPMPHSLSFKEAAAIPLAGLTAWQALFDVAHLAKGESVLIHGGAGGVGSFAIQLARAAGARPIYTTASGRHHRYVNSIGADGAIDYSRENFVEAMKREAPEGVDVVLDLVGGNEQAQSYLILKAGGRLVSTLTTPDEKMAARFNVQPLTLVVTPNGEELAEIGRLIDAGQVKTPHLHEFLLKDIGAAQAESQSQHVDGKIVIKVKDGGVPVS